MVAAGCLSLSEALDNTLTQNRVVRDALARREAREQLAALDAQLTVKGAQYGGKEGTKALDLAIKRLSRAAGMEDEDGAGPAGGNDGSVIYTAESLLS